MSRSNREPRRGVTLITSLSVLVVLALMATVFATLAGVERNISRNYVDAVRARFLADSGVNHAIGSITACLDNGRGFIWRQVDDPKLIRENRSWIYAGEDLFENGILSSSADVVNPGVLDTSDCPLELAPSPSFAMENNALPPAGPGFPSPPRRMRIDGIPTLAGVSPKRVGVSGALENGTYGRNADTYSLRLIDANALIYINDENPNIPRIIDLVLFYLGEKDPAVRAYRIPGLAPGSPGNYGDRIWKLRPYYSLIDLRRVNLPNTVQTALQSYFTTHAWVDDKVVNPVPLSEYEVDVARSYPARPRYVRPREASTGRPIYRYGRGKTATGANVPANIPLQFCRRIDSAVDRAHAGIYGWDEVNPQWIEVASRAPIDINFAPREVLRAMMEGLQGFFALEGASNVPEYGYDFIHRNLYDPGLPPYMYNNLCKNLHCFTADEWARGHEDKVATLYRTLAISGPAMGTTVAGGPDAADLADRILRRRSRVGPFTSWEEFHAFVDAMVNPGRGIWDPRAGVWRNESRQRVASQAVADVLKANFNPNLHLNELNPNAPLLMRVDKTDLIVNSSEGTLRPMGIFRIDSLGRVLQPARVGEDAFTTTANTIAAEARVTAIVKCFDVKHHTNQKDFYEGSAFQAAANAGGTSGSFTTETGPEPNSGPAPRENEYEGYVQLATVGGGDPAGLNNGRPKFTIPNGNNPGHALGSQMHAHFTYDYNLHGASRGLWRTLTSVGAPGNFGSLHYNFRDPTEEGRRSYTSPYCPTSDALSGNPRADRYRLAHSYRIDDKGRLLDANGRAIAPNRVAPSDLRVDGAYSERHSALVYSPGNVFSPVNPPMTGAAAYWIKPSYEATNAGKVRTYFNLSRLHRRDPLRTGIPGAPRSLSGPQDEKYRRDGFNPTPFGHFFLPHQLYDLARNVPAYNSIESIVREGLSMEYFTINQQIFDADNNGEPNFSDPTWSKTQKFKLRYSLVDPRAVQYYSDHSLQTMYGFKPRSFAFGYAFIWDTSGISPNHQPKNLPKNVILVKGQEIATNTPTLNHIGHPHLPSGHDRFDPRSGDLLDQGHWIHVVVAWDQHANRGGVINDPYQWRNNTRIFVNGRQINVSRGEGEVGYWNPIREVWQRRLVRWIGRWWFRGRNWRDEDNYFQKKIESWTWQWYNGTFNWGRDEYGRDNPIRIGSPSVLGNPAHRPDRDDFRYESNYPSDSTIDEFYVWGQPGDSPNLPAKRPERLAQALFSRGRYCNTDGAAFTSAPMNLTEDITLRTIPPPPGAAATRPPGTRNYRLYGMYWTAYTDNIYDYRPTSSPATGYSAWASFAPSPPRKQNVDLEFYAQLDSGGPFVPPNNSNDPKNKQRTQNAWFEEWTPFRDPKDPNQPATITDPKNFKYQFKFRYPSYRANQILLETPILDDVWIIYGPKDSEILEWVQL